MPYIAPELRDGIDDVIDAAIEDIRDRIAPSDMIGTANYAVTRMVTGLLHPEVGGWRYRSLAEVVATLEAAKLEIYRRLVVPYEDRCIDKNGDLLELEETTL